MAKGWVLFFKKGFYVTKFNSRALFLLTFFISISIFSAWLDRLERQVYGVKPGVTMAGEDMSGLLPGEVHDVIEHLALRYHKLPAEPRIDKDNGAIIAEQDGCLFDVDSSMKKVLAADVNQKIQPDIKIIHSRYRSQDLEKINTVVGYYETWFSGSYQRFTNISLALASLNNSLLWPGEEFSFNETVGPRTPERGYMPAPVILMGASEIDYGGGVCQVSSTLYNAADKAGLEIIERHPHTRAVHYVPAGKDATVSYGDLDFKLINNCDSAIIIKSGTSQGKVWVKIMGEGN